MTGFSAMMANLFSEEVVAEARELGFELKWPETATIPAQEAVAAVGLEANLRSVTMGEGVLKNAHTLSADTATNLVEGKLAIAEQVALNEVEVAAELSANGQEFVSPGKQPRTMVELGGDEGEETTRGLQ
ncbi:MAG: hypothetical protein J7M26_09045 [Armatimonadetes bacterium]|nr:hypothetical protein [Armatimonadota bacterium]